MAKWGEGDPRWIVEERPDATNCGNWHWVEKDATGWSRNRLTELLTKQTLKSGPIDVEFKDFNKLEGDATANNRKAKLIFFWEWTIVINFEARLKDSELVYNGTVEILNLSDEYEASEIKLSNQVNNNGPHVKLLLDILNSDGLSFFQSQLHKYIVELKKEYSQGLILPTDKGQIRPQAVAKGKTTIVDKHHFQNKVVVDKEKSEDQNTTKVADEVVEFELVETFKLSPDHLFEILTQPKMISLWCPNFSVESKEGGAFSLLGDIITGNFLKIVDAQKIIMSWRLKSYPLGVYANIEMNLKDKGDSVDLHILAKGVPKKLLEDTKTGFNRYYFQNIGHRFGCTLKMI